MILLPPSPFPVVDIENPVYKLEEIEGQSIVEVFHSPSSKTHIAVSKSEKLDLIHNVT